MREALYLAAGMSMFVCSLNSGSNGNCYYLENQEEAILVDAGLSCRETVKRLKRLRLSIKKVKAVFVSHEHSDHIYGITTISKKYRIPVYITPATLENSRVTIDPDLVCTLRAHDPVTVGRISVTAFPKLHDACDPHSFVVACDAVRVGVFTDIGAPCEQVVRHFRECHAAFLEANYDPDMLDRGRYPFHLKNRIRGGKGHMSNEQALELFAAHRPPYMSHLFLSHLSRDNNSPKLVKNIFTRIAAGTEIVIASRDRETQLYHIRHSRRPLPPVARRPTHLSAQLSLF